MVVGDNRNFVSALITVDAEALEFWKKQNNKTGSIADLVDDADLRAAVAEDFEAAGGVLDVAALIG